MTTNPDPNTPPAPVIPPSEPAAVTPPAPAGAGASPPAATPPAPAPGAEPPKPPARERDWRDDRIDRLTAQLRDTQRQMQTPPPGNNQNPPPPSGVPEAEVNNRAMAMAAQIRFNEECERVANDGRKAYQDFDDKVKELTRVVTPGAEGQYATLVAAAIRTGDAARVLHQLGSDLKLAQRMLAMDPLSMTAELTRMAVGATPARNEISNAPAPITPVSTRSSGIADANPADPQTGDGLTTAEWMKRRNEQVKTQTGRGARFR